MKSFFIIFIIAACSAISAVCESQAGQDRTSFVAFDLISHERYIDQLKAYDIDLTPFEGFDTIDMRGRDKVGTPQWYNIRINKSYPIGFENSERSAMILLPKIYTDNKILKQGEYVESEIRNNNRNLELDVRPLIKVIAQDDMSKYANADTVVIYDLDLLYNDAPYIGVYYHCIGVYLRKAAHPSLLLKIMLTEDAYYDNKDKYISFLLDHIRYGDNPNEKLVELEKLQADIIDLNFPSQKKACRGFLLGDNNGDTSISSHM